MECKNCEDGNIELTLQINHNQGYSRYCRCTGCQANIGTALNRNKFEQLKKNGYRVVVLDSYDELQKSSSTNRTVQKSSLFKNELEIQDWFYRVFSEWFFIAREVPGIHLVERSAVRVDFMLFPRKILVDNGFHKDWFGVEVKLFPSDKEELAAPSKALWQAVSYNDSEFDLTKSNSANFRIENISPKKPSYMMLFSNRSFKKGYDEYVKQHGEEVSIQHEYIMRTISVVGLYAKVGMISINEFSDKSNLKRWDFNFGREIYYSFLRKNNYHMQDEYHLRNNKLINKKRVGHL